MLASPLLVQQPTRPTGERRAPAACCRHLAKEFADGPARVPAVRDVSLEIPFGKLTLLAGPSGCGKTTLLSLMAGLLEPTAGEITILGTDLTRLSGPEKVRLRSLQLGLVFQQYHLLPALTAVENVAVPLTVAGQPRSAALTRAAATLRQVDLGDYLDALPRRLSGGQQQRVAIARALVHQPRLLLCDEPTSALDEKNGQAVMALLRRLASRSDRAVVVVTHDPRVYAFGDRVIHMNDGRIDRVDERVAAERVRPPSESDLRLGTGTRDAARLRVRPPSETNLRPASVRPPSESDLGLGCTGTRDAARQRVRPPSETDLRPGTAACKAAPQRASRGLRLHKLLLPLAALVLLLLAAGQAVKAGRERPTVAPPYAPAEAPFRDQVAGLGIVEAGSENVAVGAPAPGLVREVFVQVGQSVRAGQPLFTLDTRSLEAELRVREANLAQFEAQLRRLEDLPRSEELPIAAAKVSEARADLAEKQDSLARGRRAAGAVSSEILMQLEQSRAAAAARVARAEAEENLLRAGASAADKEPARAAVTAAQAQIRQTQVELDRLCVKAPLDGTVLRVNIRAGEAAGAAPGSGLVVLGNIEPLHVRVEIDEHDILRWRPEAPARAVPLGDARQGWPLEFVRVEPMIVAKKALSGGDGERVDSRVLQVVYALPRSPGQPPYVGQQVNVFVDSSESDESNGSSPPSELQARGNGSSERP
jgi:ABC-type lipoprotein export system ATPase subunit/multidrug efflux pump subunit AcrA (membrane-fusion protein)